MSDFSYDLLARQLRYMGFTDFQQIDSCLANYDDVEISRILTGVRQGQITRFEYTMLAALGENYIKRHPWNHYDWFIEHNRDRLERLKLAGISIGDYEPPLITMQTLDLDPSGAKDVVNVAHIYAISFDNHPSKCQKR
jgi:hypothetical protein